MRLVLISDTHNQHLGLSLPKGDVLIHAGDVSGRGQVKEVEAFMDWFSGQDFPHKICIAGNHDFFFEQADPTAVHDMIPEGVHYLNDSGVTIEGVSFWGSPITPWFYDWAFNRQRGKEIEAHWALIPEQTRVLITHGPAMGILDRTLGGQHVGCADLYARIRDIQPELHVFGHIHEANGRAEQGNTTYVNASILDHAYQRVFSPQIFDLM